MSKTKIILFLLSLTLYVCADTYWVGFKDKNGSVGTLDQPEQYLSHRALQRREKQNIAIDSTDLPVSKIYTDSLRHLGFQILFASKWNNGVTVLVPQEADVKEQLEQLSFVDSVQCTHRTKYDPNPQWLAKHRKRGWILEQDMQNMAEDDVLGFGTAKRQAELINVNLLHRLGFAGQGLMLALVDDAFSEVDKMSSFDYVRERILGTYNVVEPQEPDVYNAYPEEDHGTMCFSLIAAMRSDFRGTAPEASFYLMRTEMDVPETEREADAQAAAFELADSLGVDVISSSLGYLEPFDDPSSHRYYNDMNGKVYRNSIAANMAARKGMVVCVAAGNEGNDEWHYIDSPADADSILAVGAVKSNGQKTNFSSFGPTADGRIKPDVCAMGQADAVVDPMTDEVKYGNGTSFATPIMAGGVASLWSALPELTAMQIREIILKSASQTDTPDNELGYGIPNLWKAYLLGCRMLGKTVDVQQTVTDKRIVAVYDIFGRKTRFESANGIIIVVYSDGTTEKIIRH